MKGKPKIAVFKFTGCAGCQLEFLHLEDEFLDLLELFDIRYWVFVISYSGLFLRTSN